MAHREITYTVGERTFTGWFEIVGHEDVKAVSLQFDSRSVSATLGRDDPEKIARSLLTRLAIAELGSAGRPQVPASSGSDTHH